MSQKTNGLAAMCCGVILAVIGGITLSLTGSAVSNSVMSFHAEGTEFSFECKPNQNDAAGLNVISLYHNAADAGCQAQYDATTVTFSNSSDLTHTSANLKDFWGTMKANCSFAESSAAKEAVPLTDFLAKEKAVPLTDFIAKGKESIRRLAKTRTKDFAGKQNFADFSFYGESDASLKTHGCIPGKYTVKSTNGKTIYAVSSMDKLGEAVGGIFAMGLSFLAMVGLCCCGACSCCLGLFLVATDKGSQQPQTYAQQTMPQVQMGTHPR